MKKIFKMIGFLAIYYVLTVAIIFPVISGFDHIKVLNSLYDVAPAVCFGVTDPILVTCFFLFFKYVKKRKLTEYVNLTKISLNMVILYAAIGVALGFFSYSFVSTSFIKTNCPDLTSSIKGFIAAGNVFALLYLVPMNSFYKEVSYRGVMLNEVKNNNLPNWVALLIPSLMYCSLLIISGNVIGVLLYAILGNLLFGVIYLLGKSLWSSVLAQMCCTLGMVFIKRTIPKSFFNNTNSIVISIASIILLIVLMTVLVKKTESLRGDGKNNLLAPKQEATV
jgi:membrane protease YdiL (CAAX protease family)